MAVVEVKALKDGIRHSVSVESRTYTATLRAKVSSVSDGPIAVRDYLATQFGLTAGASWRWPLGGVATETDPAAFLQGIDIAHETNDGLSYRVTLNYAPVDPAEFGAGAGAVLNNWIMAPWTAPPTLDWASEQVEWALLRDRDGESILNTAGDPFDPPLLDSLSIPIATVSRVEKSYNPLWIPNYENTTNRNAWLGWPAESVLCRQITGSRFIDPDWGVLWTVVYSFAFRPEILAADSTVIDAGWDAYVLNAGLRELKDGKLRPILLGNSPASSPLPLDIDGKYDPQGDPEYLRFKVKRTSDFDDFNMPPDLFSASTP